MSKELFSVLCSSFKVSEQARESIEGDVRQLIGLVKPGVFVIEDGSSRATMHGPRISFLRVSFQESSDVAPGETRVMPMQSMQSYVGGHFLEAGGKKTVNGTITRIGVAPQHPLDPMYDSAVLHYIDGHYSGGEKRVALRALKSARSMVGDSSRR